MPPSSIFIGTLKSSSEPRNRQISADSWEPKLKSPPRPRPVVVWWCSPRIGPRSGSARACCHPALSPPAIRRQRIHHSARHMAAG